MILKVEDLTVRVGSIVAVHDLTFQLAKGERTGLIGESGSGKTLTALAVMGLLPDGLSASGRVLFRPSDERATGAREAAEHVLGASRAFDLMALSEERLCRLRGDRLAMIFQEPLTALNPVQAVGDQVAEPLRLHRRLGRREALAAARELLARVQMPDPADRARAYPHQLSGGQRQRAMIAMAMACSPDLLIADEPTTALDVTVQAQILDLLGDLVEQGGATLLLITHDLAVVSNVCERVLVLYGGHLVEEGATDAVFSRPRHPYTRALLDAIPALESENRKLPTIPGSVPGLGQFPPGCPFRNRCPRADQVCEQMPPLEGDAQRVACWHPLG
jgi:peptide/nickel transport system ATP-binding protein